MERARAAVHPSLTAFARLLSSATENSGGKELLVVAAHPDDETVGLGGQLRRLRRATIAHVTDGAPRDLADARANGFDDWQSYADARRRELRAGMALAGINTCSLVALGFPDQQAVYSMASLAR